MVARDWMLDGYKLYGDRFDDQPYILSRIIKVITFSHSFIVFFCYLFELVWIKAFQQLFELMTY